MFRVEVCHYEFLLIMSVDSAWEQNKLEASLARLIGQGKILETAPSTAHFVTRINSRGVAGVC
jgi:hypothetical protein